MLVTLRKNGQITLPSEVRRKLDLQDGDLLELEVKDGEIVLRRRVHLDENEVLYWTREWPKEALSEGHPCVLKAMQSSQSQDNSDSLPANAPETKTCG